MMAEHGSVRVAFETARLRLTEIRDEGHEARARAFRAACEQSARTLQIERVSIWFLREDRQAIVRELQFILSTNSFEQGGELTRTDCEHYFASLQERRVVVANNALSDPRTAELKPYLTSNGISSMLDAPIYRDGHVVGVVCHEHVGEMRQWSEREAGFATAVADLLTVLLHQAERAELRAALVAQREVEAQHAKMQALLQLARVIVHDIGNVMTVASLRADEIAQEHPSTQDLAGVLAYGAQLLGHLRAFCELRETKARVDAAAQLRKLGPTLATLVGKNIELRWSCGLAQGEVALLPIELEQLVLNLVMNAKDAIHGRGEISVELTRMSDQLHLRVQDSGCGMDEATQARIFEPFYSTKHGHSGVGLAAVYGIVARASGSIQLDSTPGKGTCFRIGLPLLVASSESEPPWSF
jgi:two-component system, cell cycle sensor histidine kinase and response regulator CckA